KKKKKAMQRYWKARLWSPFMNGFLIEDVLMHSGKLLMNETLSQQQIVKIFRELKMQWEKDYSKNVITTDERENRYLEKFGDGFKRFDYNFFLKKINNKFFFKKKKAKIMNTIVMVSRLAKINITDWSDARKLKLICTSAIVEAIRACGSTFKSVGKSELKFAFGGPKFHEY
ncbi:hypothetical protein RFI_25342, partial [Reticulomyxa filosa]